MYPIKVPAGSCCRCLRPWRWLSESVPELTPKNCHNWLPAPVSRDQAHVNVDHGDAGRHGCDGPAARRFISTISTPYDAMPFQKVKRLFSRISDDRQNPANQLASLIVTDNSPASRIGDWFGHSLKPPGPSHPESALTWTYSNSSS